MTAHAREPAPERDVPGGTTGLGLGKAIEKLDKYQKRLKRGEAARIKPAHVAKVEAKLKAKEAALEAEIARAKKPDKIERLKRKLALVRAQQARARWLAEQLEV